VANFLPTFELRDNGHVSCQKKLMLSQKKHKVVAKDSCPMGRPVKPTDIAKTDGTMDGASVTEVGEGTTLEVAM
jgi:hypothetical protein